MLDGAAAVRLTSYTAPMQRRPDVLDLCSANVRTPTVPYDGHEQVIELGLADGSEYLLECASAPDLHGWLQTLRFYAQMSAVIAAPPQLARADGHFGSLQQHIMGLYSKLHALRRNAGSGSGRLPAVRIAAADLPVLGAGDGTDGDDCDNDDGDGDRDNDM